MVLTALSILWTLIGAPISLITQIAIYTLYGAGVNLLVAYTGLVPFGASVFFGCASYAVAVFILDRIGGEFTALLFAVVFSILMALAIGALILRRKGLYFSLLTLAFSQIAFEVAFKWTAVTGGENGMQGVARTVFKSDWSLHIFVVVTVTSAMWLLWRIAHSPFGRVLQAIRENPFRAEALGYRTVVHRTLATCLAAAIAAAAGALNAIWLRYVGPDTALSSSIQIDVLVIVVIGGMGTLYGSILGAALFVIAENYLQALIGQLSQGAADLGLARLAQVLHPDRWLMWLGLMFILAVYFAPSGIYGKLRRDR